MDTNNTTLAGEAIPPLLDDYAIQVAAERIRQGADAEAVCKLIRDTYEGMRQAVETDRAAAASKIETLQLELTEVKWQMLDYERSYNEAIEEREQLEAALAESRRLLAEAQSKVAYYEKPLPVMVDGKYVATTDHRFTDEGICIRCGEDAEEWDAGCVEQIVNDMIEWEDATPTDHDIYLLQDLPDDMRLQRRTSGTTE